jgi:AcrR family transcriptional regulator
MNLDTRRYRQSARAEAARETGRRILESAVALWRERPLDEVTLQAIADGADVSVQTVIRRYDSKEGVIEAAIAEGVSGIEVHRDTAPAGDLDAALDVLLDHYEREGEAVLRTLAAEDRFDAARLIVENGRHHHRDWCARVFAPWLPPSDAPEHTARLDAFVAATDLYLWKLLRRDLGRSRSATRATFRALLDGLTQYPS